MSRSAILSTLGIALIGGGAQAASFEVRDAVARVVVIPEARNDVRVEVLKANRSLPLTVRTEGDRVVIDGKLGPRIINCRSTGENARVHILGIGEVAYADMPQVVVRAPKAVTGQAGGAVFGMVGKSESLDLGNSGCGDWVLADVSGRAILRQSGSGDTKMGASRELDVRIAGSGDVNTGPTAGPVTISVSGSGDVKIASAKGPVDIKIAGSGDVLIAGGHASDASVSVAGSGDVNLNLVAESLRARIAGSGDIRVRQVTGSVSKSSAGSGTISIGGLALGERN
ncbi:MAG: hypothetical protein CGW95_11065 [Phenylobacterium zucineum]|nr:MAG: hypothetical protein CGW95_11065 [Phenylobacterium zucineum]